MKMIQKIIAFILTFCLLACTVTVMSAAVFTSSAASAEIASSGAAEYTPRLTAPDYSNKYYYSDANVFYEYGYGMPNCTCYAWGRAYELLNKKPKLCIYGAERWYDYNLSNGYYSYGQEPKLGAIACWYYTYGSGHVAVVEKIENGKITFSNSAWGGDEFYLSTAPVDDPSAGRSSWIFQGYIYIGDFESAVQEPTEAESNGDIYRIMTEGGVNFRSGAGTSYSSLGIIPNGTELTVTKTQRANGYLWGYTTYKGQKGWFATNFARLVAKEGEQPTEAPTEAPTQSSDPPFEYAPRPDTNIVLGDVDGDGIVTVIDATRIQRIIAGLYTPTKYMLYIGDYDNNGAFDIMDAAKLRYDLAYGPVEK